MLNNREFTAAVDREEYPTDQVHVPLDEAFVNANGKIQNLLLEKFTSVAVIESKAGSVRANHYHQKDWHYAYVLDGEIWYYEREINSEKWVRAIFKKGDMFFTPPMKEHAMFCPMDTTFITFAKLIRDTEHHEQDVVRVKFVEAKEVFYSNGADHFLDWNVNIVMPDGSQVADRKAARIELDDLKD